MNDMTVPGRLAAEPEQSFEFTGEWREFLPIALTNLLLTIVTLGIYRFWAKARERRYLWSRTRFIDDSLEWTGTGKEMFLGFLIVIAILLPALFLLQFAVQALFIRGHYAAGAILAVLIYSGLLYLYHVARFRALRYRLTRSWWHGIRGGSFDSGWRYGWSGLWKSVATLGTLGLLTPWTMTTLWNERWSRMSFGPHDFLAAARSGSLFPRWLLIYLAPFVALFVLGVIGLGGVLLSGPIEDGNEAALAAVFFAAMIGVLVFYLIFLLVSLAYYALFYRTVAEATRIGELSFRFTARTKDWLLLILGHIGLVIVTLGAGLLFISYRNWSFIVRHMEAQGAVDLDTLTQSPTQAPADAEGLADAFDIGGI